MTPRGVRLPRRSVSGAGFGPLIAWLQFRLSSGTCVRDTCTRSKEKVSYVQEADRKKVNRKKPREGKQDTSHSLTSSFISLPLSPTYRHLGARTCRLRGAPTLHTRRNICRIHDNSFVRQTAVYRAWLVFYIQRATIE